MKYLALALFAFTSPVHACDEAAFAGKICVSSQPQELNGEEMGSLVCEARISHEAVYESLLAAFRNSPAWFQDRLCGLDRVAVYPLQKGTAHSWSYPALNSVGINRARIDERYDLAAQAATMLRQAKRKKMELGPVTFGYKFSGEDKGAGIRYLLAHELGHILYNPQDAKRRQRHFHGCHDIFGSYSCPKFEEGQFGFLDWVDGSGESGQIVKGEIKEGSKAIHDFAVATDPVSFTPEELDEFFRGLHSSSFVSPFALYSPEEDFCETVAHVVMAESAPELVFEGMAGERVSVWERVKAPGGALKAKVGFVRAYLGL
jgi:hypothetical protein